jgi:hypothetical protein
VIKMLGDFLKGNYLLKRIATVPWLWEAKGLACCEPGKVAECAPGMCVSVICPTLRASFRGPGLQSGRGGAP